MESAHAWSTIVVAAAAAVAAGAPSCTLEGPRDAGEAVTFELQGDLAPGEEKYLCRYVRMPASGDPELFVRGGQHTLSNGTHHYLLYRTRKAPSEWTDDLGATVTCDEHGEMAQTTAYVTGGQTPSENADFPAGAALPFVPGEILLLQGHFLNAAASARTMSVSLTLRTTPASAVAARAGVLRFYDPFIDVPPRGTSHATFRCTLKHDVTLLSAAAHMHARGVSYEAWIDPPGGPPSAAPFYTTKDGLHPTFFTGFLDLKAGTTIRVSCDYQSTEDREIFQGLSATANEMCMFSGFYYPAMDPADEDCSDMTGVGSGTAACAATSACLAACPAGDRPDFSTGDPTVGECWQRCLTASCPNASGPMFAQLACMNAKCASECASAVGDACTACATSKCADEVNACQSLACGP